MYGSFSFQPEYLLLKHSRAALNMTVPLHVTVTISSPETAPIITIGADHVPRTQPTLDLTRVHDNNSLQDPTTKRPQDLAPFQNDHVTFYKSSQFGPSFDSNWPGSEEKGTKPTSYLPSKVAFEARRKSQHAVRLGANEDGIEALENGLQTLREISESDSDFGKLCQAELLLDLGRKTEAKEALAECDNGSRNRGRNVPATRPTLRTRASIADAKFEADMRKFNNDQTEQEMLLKVSLRADDWVKAREAAEKLHRIDPSFFNLQTKMDRYRKCRQILYLGGLEEAREPIPDLGKALRFYNHGCFVTGLFHKHFDPPRSQVNILDHDDCTNLFFSAARVCVLFHQKDGFRAGDKLLTPEEFTRQFKRDGLPCSPPLTEKNWNYQALHFMEQGRSGALLESILGGGSTKPLVTAIQKKYLMVDVALAARETIRIKKKIDAALVAAGSFQNYSLLGLNEDPTPIPEIDDADFDITPERRSQPLALAPLLDTASLGDYKHSPSMPPPSSIEDSEPGSATKEKALATSRALLRWQKAFLHALAARNPTLKAALPSSSFRQDASSIIQKIPGDTAVIEYALVSSPPEGLISIVITANGIEECVWQRLETVKLQNIVSELLYSMSNVKSRNSSPISPRKRGVANVDDIRDVLSNILLKPVKKCLAMKKLIIIPSGKLGHVPWAMLLDLPVAIVPSLSIWDHLNSNRRDSRALSKVSVVDNPPRNDDGKLRDGDIPFSHIEAFYIARLHDDLPFLAGESNRKQFQEWVALSRVLHLSTHSTFDDQDPTKSGIQLFKDSLYIHDWRNLAIKADLVVFSSCLSGISKAFHSGSAFGFAHALLGTGTRVFVGSLWPVDDLATLLLMMFFYEQLQSVSPAEALHNSQIQMRNLCREDVWRLVERLKVQLDHTRVEEFVDHHAYWIDELDNLTAEELQNLREPRCWAAFVLTGYGFQRI